MHVGARGGEYIMKHFQDTIDASHQSPENMKATLEEIRAYAQNIEQEGEDAGITNTPFGGAPPAPSSSKPADKFVPF
jgi:hypothetical protein